MICFLQNVSSIHIKYNGGKGEYCITTKTMNYIFESVDKNKVSEAYKSTISSIKPSVFRKKTKKKIKNRLYKKRVPKKYSVYIKSIHFEKRKNRYYKKFGKKCMCCGSTEYVQLHHVVYNNFEFGFEKDEDLSALCIQCHKDFHDTYGVKKDMKKDFNDFLEKKYYKSVIKNICLP